MQDQFFDEHHAGATSVAQTHTLYVLTVVFPGATTKRVSLAHVPRAEIPVVAGTSGCDEKQVQEARILWQDRIIPADGVNICFDGLT